MKNILMALIFLFAFSSFANAVVVKEQNYLCKKGDRVVTLDLTIEGTTSCRLIVTQPNGGEVISSTDEVTCVMNLAKKILEYIDQGYSCSLVGQSADDEGPAPRFK